MSTWQFGDLPMFRHDLLVVDPPWAFDNWSRKGTKKGALRHYQTLQLNEIKNFRIGELAGPDCLLLLWATECMREQAHDAMRHWGFVYKSAIIWHKRTRADNAHMGTGYRVRTMHEPILIGTLGNPQHKPFPSIFKGVARHHSQKPEEFYSMIDRYCPRLTYRADIFARTARPGWVSFGDQIGLFEPDSPRGKQKISIDRDFTQEANHSTPLLAHLDGVGA